MDEVNRQPWSFRRLNEQLKADLDCLNDHLWPVALKLKSIVGHDVEGDLWTHSRGEIEASLKREKEEQPPMIAAIEQAERIQKMIDILSDHLIKLGHELIPESFK